MIRLLTGKTGSGKSYHAVSLILDSLNNDRRVFTNIKINVEYDNYVYLDELAVKHFLSYIGDTFANVENLDDKKDELKNTDYFDSDFFIDEAHLIGFRDKKESILNWLTIHRHFNQNVTVITQVPSNVHRDYLMLFHSHIDMIPPNKRLSKNSMGYKEYDSYKGERLNTKYFKPDLGIFEIYNSGNIEQGVSQNVYKLGALLVGMLFLSVFAYWSASSFFDKNVSLPSKNIIDSNSTNIISNLDNNLIATKNISNSKNNNIDNNTSEIDSHSVICSNIDGCYYNATLYTPSKFRMFVLSKSENYKQSLIAVIHKKDKSERLTKYTFYTK